LNVPKHVQVGTLTFLRENHFPTRVKKLNKTQLADLEFSDEDFFAYVMADANKLTAMNQKILQLQQVRPPIQNFQQKTDHLLHFIA
jgi:hypothetical protein